MVFNVLLIIAFLVTLLRLLLLAMLIFTQPANHFPSSKMCFEYQKSCSMGTFNGGKVLNFSLDPIGCQPPPEYEYEYYSAF